MSLGGEVLVAGAYTLTWNSVSLGLFEGDQSVPTLEHQVAAEDIGNTSMWGKTVIDSIYQGGNWFAAMVCEEYKAGPIGAFWPYGTMGLMGTIGRLIYGLSQALVFTAVAGTSAASIGPSTVTAGKSILLPGFTSRLLFGPTLRKVPLRFRLFPYDTTGGGVYGWFTLA